MTLLQRIAEIADNNLIATLISGKVKVLIYGDWYTITKDLKLIGTDGLDRQFSDLEVITSVELIRQPDNLKVPDTRISTVPNDKDVIWEG